MIEKFLEISFKKDGEHSPLFLQLESEIIQLICRGVLKPGQALPPSRELAQSLQSIVKQWWRPTRNWMRRVGLKQGKGAVFMFPVTCLALRIMQLSKIAKN
jgi:DNA-binding transcriptional MocR family regulator